MPSLSANIFSMFAINSLSLSIRPAYKFAKSCSEALVSSSVFKYFSDLSIRAESAATSAANLSKSSLLGPSLIAEIVTGPDFPPDARDSEIF